MSQSVLELDPVVDACAAPRGMPGPAPATAGFDHALHCALAAEAVPDGQVQGRDAEAWWRLALMQSFVTPLAHDRAARLPLRLLPPAGLHPCNPVQALQVRIGTELLRPGGTQRLRTIARRLPSAARGDFHRFVSALLPRLLDAAAGATPRAALEAAWRDARVNRRWLQFALPLDADTCVALLRGRPTAASSRSGENQESAAAPKDCRWPSINSTMPRRFSPPARGWPTAPA